MRISIRGQKNKEVNTGKKKAHRRVSQKKAGSPVQRWLNHMSHYWLNIEPLLAQYSLSEPKLAEKLEPFLNRRAGRARLEPDLARSNWLKLD